MYIIAADVGGTKTRLVYAECDKPDDILYEARLESGAFESFNQLLARFIEHMGQPHTTLGVLSLALPGLVNGSVAELTNLPWTIRSDELQAEFGVQQVLFINDFQASAYGLAKMKSGDLVELNTGARKNDAIKVVLGAGTGLGLTWLQNEQGRVSAYASEGGHIDFAPVNNQQIQLLEFLLQRYSDVLDGHVSYERLLSGAGLVTLYEFCSHQESENINAAWVSAQALKDNQHAQTAMQLFVQIYGSYVGNIALLLKPEGGIYIAGGIAGKIIHWMLSADFLNAYLQKGRMRTLVRSIPVNIVTNERIGALGALTYAVSKQQVT